LAKTAGKTLGAGLAHLIERRGIMRNHSFAYFIRINLAALTLAAWTGSVRADVSVSGDTSPAANTISDAGGDIGADLIIGDDDVAGLFMDFAPPLFDPLEPLEADNVIIGNNEFAIGAVTLEDFLGGDLISNGDFTIGNAGQGFLDLFDSASVNVADLLTIGALETGMGVATINGQGSRVITDGLIVGDLGFGQLTVTDRATLRSGELGTASVIGNQAGGIGIVSVEDVGARWTVGNTTTPARLIVGSTIPAAASATGTLKIVNQALVQVSDSVTISETGTIELESGGQLRILPSSVTGTSILNSGTIMGDGFINFSSQVGGTPHQFVIAGELRNQANAIEGIPPTGEFGANQRERLVVTGNVTAGDLVVNNSTMESYGGEMEFQVAVQNNFEIVARDALMRFPEGLTNEAGSFMVLGGDTTIHGPIITDVLADIFILNDSIVTVHGDFIFTESFLVAALTDVDTGSSTSTLSMVVGDNASSLNIFGNVELGNVTLSLDFVGSAPLVGDSFEILSAAGDSNGLGTFANDQINVDGKLWNIGYDADSVFVTYTGLSAGISGDFDGDGDVDGRDLIVWQRNPSLGNLSDWQSNYGQPGAITANVSAVPEPASAMLLLAGVLAMALRRQN
jgi:T5SS/PEP-CTERM-associated repeat protein